ncbi:hypothetical protein D910_11106 [Dendroctonus ponderosae]|uniref:MoaB/Mog domain-containing protein n=1 Tax=Dendroctonus ponderosae TaxID=77166 RepID=U4UUH9_DENPD|nr:hypothetical protein D910_11106 [Dendroctonus ponderosae]
MCFHFQNMGDVKFGILTVSTSCHENPAKDLAGPKLATATAEAFPSSRITFKMIVTDSFPEIVNALKLATQPNVCDVLFTVGGTGFAPSDVTPEATRAVIEKEATGLSCALIAKSLDSGKRTINHCRAKIVNSSPDLQEKIYGIKAQYLVGFASKSRPLETDLNPTSEDSENDESDSDFEESDSLDINNYKLAVTELYKDYSTGEECDIQKLDESDIQEPDNVLLKNAMEMAINKYIFKGTGRSDFLYSNSKTRLFTIVLHIAAITDMAMLSRPACGIKNRTIIVNFPGSAKAAVECFGFIKTSILHAVALLNEQTDNVKWEHQRIQQESKLQRVSLIILMVKASS